MVSLTLSLAPSLSPFLALPIPLSFPDWGAEERECAFAGAAAAARHGGGFRGNAAVTAGRGVRGDAGGCWVEERQDVEVSVKLVDRERDTCLCSSTRVSRSWKSARKKRLDFHQPRPEDSSTVRSPLPHHLRHVGGLHLADFSHCLTPIPLVLCVWEPPGGWTAVYDLSLIPFVFASTASPLGIY